jgi:peptidoglycan hydrolase-like protein with peptidoglycan-binding domain
LTALVLPSTASADPSANDWHRLRVCESSDNYRANTGNAHYGAYQFDLPTWRSVGGTGVPSNASPAEQDHRALLLWRMRGWEPWQCAAIIGLTGGPGSAGSGGSGGSGGSHRPVNPTTWPGASYRVGDWSTHIAVWQKQMGKRGAPLVGTGQFGPKTLAVVKAVQRQNGLPANGILGPLTWNLAWSGVYHAGGGAARPAVPKWPGSYYSQGDHNSAIAMWQKQMRKRGAPLVGTGQFGPKTVAVVDALQRQNGLPAVGFIGPNTWALAWTGRYHR